MPNVVREDYSLLDVADDDFISLMDDAGNEKSDMRLPEDDALRSTIVEGFEAEKALVLVLTVLKSMGEEMVCAVKEQKA